MNVIKDEDEFNAENSSILENNENNEKDEKDEKEIKNEN